MVVILPSCLSHHHHKIHYLRQISVYFLIISRFLKIRNKIKGEVSLESERREEDRLSSIKKKEEEERCFVFVEVLTTNLSHIM